MVLIFAFIAAPIIIVLTNKIGNIFWKMEDNNMNSGIINLGTSAYSSGSINYWQNQLQNQLQNQHGGFSQQPALIPPLKPPQKNNPEIIPSNRGSNYVSMNLNFMLFVIWSSVITSILYRLFITKFPLFSENIYPIVGISIILFFGFLIIFSHYLKCKSKYKLIKANDPDNGLVGIYRISLLNLWKDSIQFTLNGEEYILHNDEFEFIGKKGGKMPKIFRYLLYLAIIVLVWKFVGHIDQIVLFFINKFLGGI